MRKWVVRLLAQGFSKRLFGVVEPTEVAQGERPFTTVLQAALLHPAEPLGFEFSVDNEVAPGMTLPVAISDGLEVSYLRISMEATGQLEIHSNA